MGVSIGYKLTGAGWSECRVEIDDQTITVSASYLSDALGDLLTAVATVVEGVSDATASFDEEPGEYRWRLTRIDSDRLLIRILWFNDQWTNLPDEKGDVVYRVECRLRTFAGALLSASQRVLEEHGMDGYRRSWIEHDFPVDQQARLRRAIGGD